MRSYGVYVNGQYIHPSVTREVRAPWSSPGEGPLQKLGFLAADHAGDQEIAEAALQGALETQAQIHRGFFPLEERLAFLERLKARVLAEADRLALLIVHEVGKPLGLSRTEVTRAASTIEWTIREAAQVLKPEGLNSDATALGRLPGSLAFTLREPRGPVLAVTPFNFPLNLALHKIIPAIAAGCPVILKPSPKAALVGLTIADLCHSCELPAGMLSVLNADDATTQKLARDGRVAQISFTGSARVGWQLARENADKPVFLELGGTGPVWVDASAPLEAVAKKVVTASFAFAGQICISTQRIGVDARVAPAFEKLLARETEAIHWGQPTLDEVIAGPVIDAAAAERLTRLRESTLRAGARVLAEAGAPRGLSAPHGNFLRPALLTNLPSNADFDREEVFGPLASVRSYPDFTNWRDEMNDSPYRFQASVFTGQLDVGLRAARELRFGAVLVNEPSTFRLEPMPFGGRGLSGNSREGPRYAMESFTEAKSVILHP